MVTHDLQGDEDEIVPVSQVDPNRLPPPTRLPPPKPAVVLDPETGYSVDDVCARFAWYLDSLFVARHPGYTGRSIQPTVMSVDTAEGDVTQPEGNVMEKEMEKEIE